MEFNLLIWISIACGICHVVLFGFAHLPSQKRIPLWITIILLYIAVVLTTYELDDMAYQWLLIETSTLLGTLLISSNSSSKSLQAAWKFLLINSFGLGIAYLGIILISYSIPNVNTFNVQIITDNVDKVENPILLKAGLWLAIFGYSAKLGLFPNLFWVGDTYSESSSQVSGLLAGFLPVAVSFALVPILELDRKVNVNLVSPRNLFFISSILTILYTIFVQYNISDIRRISAKIALYHSGVLGIFLWIGVDKTALYFILASIILVKSILFLSMGAVRLVAGSREIDRMTEEKSFPRWISFLYVFTIFLCFTFPFSTNFYADMFLVKLGLEKEYYWLIVVPILGIILFGITISKILPLLKIPNGQMDAKIQKIVKVRVTVYAILLIAILFFSSFGYRLLSSSTIISLGVFHER